ncbi:hypothetical protein ABH15_00260 [Methanoculleus taiwanensis]|uniref:DUF2098 domain-containing protein n=1 Tax=Methanoculleus taiwanensis TaxID=1550565 RepID=A0A498H417_9EURY|nr:DUF2098 domain-containing protein [Methanoculleus taiwanensis]RXE56656.1 hypothetical protein ABH15_00260 [Methanoculleus taiwanensis]
MKVDEVAVGIPVRYPRTGTSGTVLALAEIDGRQYAELDSTHLFYLVDELVVIGQAGPVERRHEEERNIDTFVEQEKEFAERLKEAWVTTDQSCEGGG